MNNNDNTPSDTPPPVPPPAPMLHPTPSQERTSGPGEDWTGVTNPAVRKKLQNKLNQRAQREPSCVQRSLWKYETNVYLGTRRNHLREQQKTQVKDNNRDVAIAASYGSNGHHISLLD